MHIQSVTFEEETILEQFIFMIFQKCPRVPQYNEKIIEIVLLVKVKAVLTIFFTEYRGTRKQNIVKELFIIYF